MSLSNTPLNPSNNALYSPYQRSHNTIEANSTSFESTTSNLLSSDHYASTYSSVLHIGDISIQISPSYVSYIHLSNT